MFWRNKKFLTIIKAFLLCAAVLIIGFTLSDQWPKVINSLSGLNWWWVAASLVVGTVYRVLNAAVWSQILKAVGHNVCILKSTRIWLITETLRWLPGGVWGFASRVGEARKLGVPARVASVSLPLELIITIAAWSITAILGLFLSDSLGVYVDKVPPEIWPWIIATFIGMPLGFFIVIKFFPGNNLVIKVRNLFRKLMEIMEMNPHIPSMVSSFVHYNLLCILQGVAFWFLIRGMDGGEAVSLWLAVGINSVGWLIGFFAIGAPGGIGVREGGIGALLAAFISLETAIAVALLWRFSQIISEIICIGLALGIKINAHHTTPENESDLVVMKDNHQTGMP